MKEICECDGTCCEKFEISESAHREILERDIALLPLGKTLTLVAHTCKYGSPGIFLEHHETYDVYLEPVFLA